MISVAIFHKNEVIADLAVHELEKNEKERLFAKVSSLDGLKIGDVATIQGNISPANFEPNRKECMMLLDNAKFIK